jgi:hypothetical protein
LLRGKPTDEPFFSLSLYFSDESQIKTTVVDEPRSDVVFKSKSTFWKSSSGSFLCFFLIGFYAPTRYHARYDSRYIVFYFCIFKMFLKIFNFLICTFTLNYFLYVFLDYFDMLILKINFLKKKYFFNVFF